MCQYPNGKVRSLSREDPLEKETATHSSILAWKIHGQRSLVGYSLWGREESDMNEQLSAMVWHEPKVMINPILHT